MHREQLVAEIKVLMDLVARNTTSLAPEVMEIDVAECVVGDRQMHRTQVQIGQICHLLR